MGFLDNLAMRRAEKALRPFMRNDERLIEYDVMDIDPLGEKKTVVLSNRAIYLGAQGNEAVRVPYTNIIQLQAQGDRVIGVGTVSGNSFILRAIGSPKGDVYDTIAHHLDKVIKHKQEVELPNGSLVLGFLRPMSEDEEPVWVWMSADEVDLQDSEVQQVLEEAVAPAVERHGVPVSWDEYV